MSERKRDICHITEMHYIFDAKDCLVTLLTFDRCSFLPTFFNVNLFFFVGRFVSLLFCQAVRRSLFIFFLLSTKFLPCGSKFTFKAEVLREFTSDVLWLRLFQALTNHSPLLYKFSM